MTRSLPDQSASPEYHKAHLSFLRTEILEAAANREPILAKLHAYTRDVIHAERDGAFDEQWYYTVVKMLSGTWNVRDERTGEWVPEGVGLDKPAARHLADGLNALAPREGQHDG